LNSIESIQLVRRICAQKFFDLGGFLGAITMGPVIPETTNLFLDHIDRDPAPCRQV